MIGPLLAEHSLMRHGIEEVESPNRTEEVPESSADDLLADGKHPSEPLGVSLTELLVRQTLTDLENRMTAGHHLTAVHPAAEQRDEETEGADEDRKVT
jgi:hypothetical protein